MTESPQPSPPPQWVWSFRTATCCPPHPTLLQWLQILDGWAGGGGLQEHFLPLPWLPHLSASPPFQLGLLFHPNHLFSCQEERSLQRFKRREGGTPLGKFPGCPGHPHCSPGFTLNSQPRGPCRAREEQHQETKTNLGTVVQDIPPGAWRRPNSAD